MIDSILTEKYTASLFMIKITQKVVELAPPLMDLVFVDPHDMIHSSSHGQDICFVVSCCG